MTRFLPYRFHEQAGDELIFLDELGGERRIPFKFIDVSLPPLTTACFVA